MKNYIKSFFGLISVILLFVCLASIKQDKFFFSVSVYACLFSVTICLIRFNLRTNLFKTIRWGFSAASMFAFSYLFFDIYRACNYSFNLVDLSLFKDISFVFIFTFLLSSLCDNYVYDEDKKRPLMYVNVLLNIIVSAILIYSFTIDKQFKSLYDNSTILLVTSFILFVISILNNKKTA